MRALRRVKIEAHGQEAPCDALFDSGSGITAVQGKFYEENFRAEWLALEKPLKVFWINGQSMTVNKYIQAVMVIDGYRLPEVIFILDEWVEEVEIDGRKVRLPELVIGSGTMDKYGIALDPKEGVKITGASLLI